VRWHVFWWLPLVFIEFVAVSSLIAQQAGFPYPQEVSLAEAVAAGFRAKGLGSLARPEFAFVPLSVAAIAGAEVVLRRRLARAVVRRVALARAFGGLAVVLLLADGVKSLAVIALSPFCAPLMTLGVLGGDGEFYDDGFMFYGALGWWAWYQLALYFRDTRGRAAPAGECARCGYPAAGLAERSECPECGFMPDPAPGVG
jgi:hypothetical protein